MPKKKRLDAHYIITHILNVHLRDLFKVRPGKAIAIVRIGESKEMIWRKEDPLKKRISYWLDSFRNKLWQDSQKYGFDFESFKEEMGPLLYFYENVLRSEEETLRKLLIEPLEACFKDIDNYLKTSYFSSKVEELEKKHRTAIKVLDSLSLPVSNVEITVSWSSEIDKYFPVQKCLLKTDSKGEAHVLLMKGNYDVRLDEYGKESSLTVPKDKEVVVKVPREFQVACPYCKRLFQIELSDKWSEVTCINMDCNKKWHEGVFRVLLGKVASRRRGLGRNRTTCWSIRLLTPQNEDFIEFAPKSRFVPKQKDILTVSHEKTSKGIFKKKWTGGWDSRSKILVNNTGREPIIIQHVFSCCEQKSKNRASNAKRMLILAF